MTAFASGALILVETPFGPIRAAVLHKQTWRCADCGEEVWQCRIVENGTEVNVCTPAMRRMN